METTAQTFSTIIVLLIIIWFESYSYIICYESYSYIIWYFDEWLQLSLNFLSERKKFVQTLTGVSTWDQSWVHEWNFNRNSNALKCYTLYKCNFFLIIKNISSVVFQMLAFVERILYLSIEPIFLLFCPLFGKTYSYSTYIWWPMHSIHSLSH